MMRKIRISKTVRVFLLTVVAILGLTIHVSAKVLLPAFLTDNMVLQQKATPLLWGKAAPGKPVIVTTSWNNKKYSASTGSSGEWKINVSTPAAGGPYTVTFDDGDAITLKNILIGEVWLCSGQSNMEMPLAGWGKITNYEQEIAAANYPNIRLLQVEHVTSNSPLNDVKVANGGWQPCSPKSVAEFSAVAYSFARNIYQTNKVPIGLIHTSWGGTIAEAWTSGSSLKKMPAFAPVVEQMENGPKTQDDILKNYKQQLQIWQNEVNASDPGFKQNNAVWASADFNTSSWKSMKLPNLWEKAGLEDFDGVVWFRKKITVPANLSGKDMKLSLGPVDDQDITWINGTEVVRTEGWDKKRAYNIPGKLLKSGENTITVRVLDGSGGGGIYGDEKELTLSASSGQVIPLAGAWQYAVAMDKSKIPPMPQTPDGPNRVTVLYNAMIHPFIPYTIRGAIWYQGESNADRAYQYRELFPLMIADWREKWGNSDFPFYFVQLANFMNVNDQPAESAWAELREAQLKTLSVPNTGMAVAIDIGEANDIHPKNKQEVGRRLALIARAKVYKEDIAFSGPAYQSHKIEGSTVILNFDHANGGLEAKRGTVLKGFVMAGEDKKFYWADAKIVGNTVVVSSPDVAKPVAVRYAWANNPICNLYNKAGLPASPFRTDDWQGITFAKE